MGEEPNSVQASEIQPSAGYPRHRFIILLIVLALLVIVIGAAQRIQGPGVETGVVSEGSLEGDVAIKLSYAYGRWMSFAPAASRQREQVEAFRREQRRSAITWYQRAAREDPSPSNIRPLIIIQYPSKREREIKRLGAGAHANARAEAAMWRSIYLAGGKLSLDQVDAYSARIRGLKLGWYEHLALADLFERAGLAAQAAEEDAEAARAAGRTVALLLVLLLVLALLGMLGIAAIIWYATTRNAARLDARDGSSELTPQVRSLAAGCLLETFVVYLAIVVGTQLAAAFALASEVYGPGATNPVRAVLITAAVYAFAGLLSIAYLARRLRSAGWSWRTVGLTTRNPLRDVAWGIGGYAAALPLLVIASLLSRLLSRYVETPSNPVVPLFVESETWVERLVLFGLAAIAAPFFEELFFRGVLYNSFRAKWGARAGIMLSAAVFASVHPLPLGFLPIFVLGFIFAVLVQHRGSLLPAMVAHGINNCVAFTVLLILTGS